MSDIIDVEMQRQCYERHRRDRDKRIESRREAERVINMKTKAVKYSHLKVGGVYLDPLSLGAHTSGVCVLSVSLTRHYYTTHKP